MTLSDSDTDTEQRRPIGINISGFRYNNYNQSDLGEENFKDAIKLEEAIKAIKASNPDHSDQELDESLVEAP